MAEFDPAIEAQISGQVVRLSVLTEFRFVSATWRLWLGFGTLTLADGSKWVGIGNQGVRSPITSGTGLAVDEVTYSLFGGDELLANIADDADEANGQEVIDYLQFFAEDWSLLGEPFEVWRGVMGPLTVRWEKAEVGEQRRRVVSVRAQNAMTNRRRPVHSFYTEGDQQARSSGDNIFAGMSQARIKIVWPKFS